jgi:hypothetical protein
MLAYVFWHWPKQGIGRPEYEATQRAFHDALTDDPPRGYLRSVSVAITGAPWANAGWDAYEDWYLLHDSAALDHLNDAAISAGRQLPHDAAAAAAAGGTAALYSLRLGSALQRPSHAYWFAKPDTVRYHECDRPRVPDGLRRLMGHGARPEPGVLPAGRRVHHPAARVHPAAHTAPHGLARGQGVNPAAPPPSW